MEILYIKLYMIAVYSNWCSAFKLVQCVQTGTVRSNWCSAFKLVQCVQTGAVPTKQ